MRSRRQIVLGAGAAAGLALLPPGARATPELRDQAIEAVTKGAAVQEGRVTLTIPSVAENGLSVYTTVEVDSAMTAAEHVRAIHIFSEQNPIAHLLTVRLGPHSGAAKVSTNLRLAASQQVTALAELSDGSFWRDSKDVVVTIAACIDGG